MINNHKKAISEALSAAYDKAPPKTGGPAKTGDSISIAVGHDAKNITVYNKSKVNISAASEYITDEEAVYLKGLAEEVARCEKLYAAHTVSVPLVWQKLRDRLGVTSYKLILKSRYAEAVDFLLSWAQQAYNDRAESSESLEKRAKTYRTCHAIAKQYGLYAEMRLLLERKWNVDSMRALDNKELEELHKFMKALQSQYKQ